MSAQVAEKNGEQLGENLRKAPPPPNVENRGTPEYTRFHTSAGVAEKVRKKETRIVTEIEEDAEKTIAELCGKIQKFYPSRWEKAVRNEGKLTTMAANFRNFLDEIEEILNENPNTRLSPKWAKRVDEYRAIFKTEIQQHT